MLLHASTKSFTFFSQLTYSCNIHTIRCVQIVAISNDATDLLLLELSILGNEVRQCLIDTTLLQELIELILKRNVERVELQSSDQHPQRERAPMSAEKTTSALT